MDLPQPLQIKDLKQDAIYNADLDSSWENQL